MGQAEAEDWVRRGVSEEEMMRVVCTVGWEVARGCWMYSRRDV